MESFLDILYRDDDIIVVDKPAGYHVHPPELSGVKIPREKILLYELRNIAGRFVYPVHRLDAATTGCLVFALSPEMAKNLSAQIESKSMRKFYKAVLRGWTPDSFIWNQELKSQKDPLKSLPALSKGKTLQKISTKPYPKSSFKESRYSLVEIEIKTGRFHQIRRHANLNNHPVVGDVAHGDRHHNHFFKDELNISGLCLRAQKLEFFHPRLQNKVQILAPLIPPWEKIHKLFEEIAKQTN